MVSTSIFSVITPTDVLAQVFLLLNVFFLRNKVVTGCFLGSHFDPFGKEHGGPNGQVFQNSLPSSIGLSPYSRIDMLVTWEILSVMPQERPCLSFPTIN